MAKTQIEPTQTVTVGPRKPIDWKSLIKKAEITHWRRIAVAIKFREWCMAGKPAKLDAAEAMVKARGLGDVIEAKLEEITDADERALLAEGVKDEGKCEFHRRELPGLWLPTNNIKAGLKENWGVLGLRKKETGSRGALAEGVFVCAQRSDSIGRNWELEGMGGLDWIYLGPAVPPPKIYTGVAHTTDRMGKPCSSIKRHEYVEKVTVRFEIKMARAIEAKLSSEGLARTMNHFAEHGLGACRSGGYGKFDIVEMEDID